MASIDVQRDVARFVQGSVMPFRLCWALLLACSVICATHAEPRARESASSDAMAEQVYLASRDAAIAKIKRREASGPETSNAQMKEDERALHDLESKLRRAIGPVSVEGFSGKGETNLQTLSSEDIGFGALDALVLHSRSGKDNVFVTSEGLLGTWLKQHRTWWDNEAPLPQDATDALRREAFYTQAISSDAAVSLYGTVPIESPPGTTFAVAQLEATSQDQPPALPDELVVSALKGGKLFIFVSPLKTPFILAAPCKVVRDSYDRKIQGLSEAKDPKSGGGAKPDADKSIDDLTLLEKEAADASLHCFLSEAKGQPAFGAAANQAQTLVDAASGR